MIDTAKFKPKTVYVIYIAATPEKVWQALTDPAFSKHYFFGFAVDVEPKQGGYFRLSWPDGRLHVTGEVVDWSPPRRFSCSECLVTFDIEPSGDAIKLTMTESHSWDIPRDILKGGESGWPKILSGLKSLLETGKPLAVDTKAGPSTEFMAAVKKAVAEKPWLSAS
jgi:uncharacterized protein YndB with AHSA1/START domain